MTNYVVQQQSQKAQQYNLQLDDNSYSASIYWMAFSQRLYIAIYDSSGNIILNTALISSDYNINMLYGYFNSILYYNQEDSVMQVLP
jgi:hypothetical protein